MFNKTEITKDKGLKAIENLLALEVARKTEVNSENVPVFIGVSEKESSISECMTNDLNENERGSLVIKDNPKKESESLKDMTRSKCNKVGLKNAKVKLNRSLKEVIEYSRKCIGPCVAVDKRERNGVGDSKEVMNVMEKNEKCMLKSHIIEDMKVEQGSQILEDSDLKNEKLVQNLDKKTMKENYC
jgi:hypothetical protein